MSKYFFLSILESKFFTKPGDKTLGFIIYFPSSLSNQTHSKKVLHLIFSSKFFIHFISTPKKDTQMSRGKSSSSISATMLSPYLYERIAYFSKREEQLKVNKPTKTLLLQFAMLTLRSLTAQKLSLCHTFSTRYSCFSRAKKTICFPRRSCFFMKINHHNKHYLLSFDPIEKKKTFET